MSYPKNFLSSIVFLLSFGFSLHVISADREDLYELGKSAYESQEYVIALKNLYAFYVVNIESIENDPSFKISIEKKMAECEAKLTLALASNKSIDMRGGKFILRTNEIDGGFIGKGKEVQDLLKNNSIDLERMMDNRQGVSFGE